MFVEFFQNVFKIVGQRRAESHSFACTGVIETQFGGVQKLSVKSEFLCFITVNGVADDRMPDIFAVYPYLVRSSGV